MDRPTLVGLLGAAAGAAGVYVFVVKQSELSKLKLIPKSLSSAKAAIEQRRQKAVLLDDSIDVVITGTVGQHGDKSVPVATTKAQRAHGDTVAAVSTQYQAVAGARPSTQAMWTTFEVRDAAGAAVVCPQRVFSRIAEIPTTDLVHEFWPAATTDASGNPQFRHVASFVHSLQRGNGDGGYKVEEACLPFGTRVTLFGKVRLLADGSFVAEQPILLTQDSLPAVLQQQASQINRTKWIAMGFALTGLACLTYASWHYYQRNVRRRRGGHRRSHSGVGAGEQHRGHHQVRGGAADSGADGAHIGVGDTDDDDREVEEDEEGTDVDVMGGVLDDVDDDVIADEDDVGFPMFFDEHDDEDGGGDDDCDVGGECLDDGDDFHFVKDADGVRVRMRRGGGGGGAAPESGSNSRRPTSVSRHRSHHHATQQPAQLHRQHRARMPVSGARRAQTQGNAATRGTAQMLHQHEHPHAQHQHQQQQQRARARAHAQSQQPQPQPQQHALRANSVLHAHVHGRSRKHRQHRHHRDAPATVVMHGGGGAAAGSSMGGGGGSGPDVASATLLVAATAGVNVISGGKGGGKGGGGGGGGGAARSQVVAVVSGPVAAATEGDMCITCDSEPMNAVLVPCGHQCMCNDCAIHWLMANPARQCPICREKVDRVQKVFKS